MSLFGSLMGDFEDDPFFGSHLRHMNNMMNSMFDPFGMMGPPALMDSQNRRERHNNMQMMPFGFPPMPTMNMNSFFSDFNNLTQQSGNCHSFTSSSVMTMTSSPDGRPQIYQESMSTRCAPGGIKETKKTVCDSRTGTKKMAIGHHIGDKAHILERQQNVHTGEREENQEFINLEEDEAEEFNKEWESKTRRSLSALRDQQLPQRDRGHKQLALPSTAASSRQSSHLKSSPAPRRGIKSASKTNNVLRPTTDPSAATASEKEDISPISLSSDTTAESTAKTLSSHRKREHSPVTETSRKRHVAANSDD